MVPVCGRYAGGVWEVCGWYVGGAGDGGRIVVVVVVVVMVVVVIGLGYRLCSRVAFSPPRGEFFFFFEFLPTGHVKFFCVFHTLFVPGMQVVWDWY